MLCQNIVKKLRFLCSSAGRKLICCLALSLFIPTSLLASGVDSGCGEVIVSVDGCAYEWGLEPNMLAAIALPPVKEIQE